jgi:hypothetical protein
MNFLIKLVPNLLCSDLIIVKLLIYKKLVYNFKEVKFIYSNQN